MIFNERLEDAIVVLINFHKYRLSIPNPGPTNNISTFSIIFLIANTSVQSIIMASGKTVWIAGKLAESVAIVVKPAPELIVAMVANWAAPPMAWFPAIIRT